MSSWKARLFLILASFSIPVHGLCSENDNGFSIWRNCKDLAQGCQASYGSPTDGLFTPVGREIRLVWVGNIEGTDEEKLAVLKCQEIETTKLLYEKLTSERLQLAECHTEPGLKAPAIPVSYRIETTFCPFYDDETEEITVCDPMTHYFTGDTHSGEVVTSSPGDKNHKYVCEEKFNYRAGKSPDGAYDFWGGRYVVPLTYEQKLVEARKFEGSTGLDNNKNFRFDCPSGPPQDIDPEEVGQDKLCDNIGDPYDALYGQVEFTVVDIATPNPLIRFERTYSSNRSSRKDIGINWTSNWAFRIFGASWHTPMMLSGPNSRDYQYVYQDRESELLSTERFRDAHLPRFQSITLNGRATRKSVGSKFPSGKNYFFVGETFNPSGVNDSVLAEYLDGRIFEFGIPESVGASGDFRPLITEPYYVYDDAGNVAQVIPHGSDHTSFRMRGKIDKILDPNSNIMLQFKYSSDTKPLLETIEYRNGTVLVDSINYFYSDPTEYFTDNSDKYLSSVAYSDGTGEEYRYDDILESDPDNPVEDIAWESAGDLTMTFRKSRNNQSMLWDWHDTSTTGLGVISQGVVRSEYSMGIVTSRQGTRNFETGTFTITVDDENTAAGSESVFSYKSVNSEDALSAEYSVDTASRCENCPYPKVAKTESWAVARGDTYLDEQGEPFGLRRLTHASGFVEEFDDYDLSGRYHEKRHGDYKTEKFEWHPGYKRKPLVIRNDSVVNKVAKGVAAVIFDYDDYSDLDAPEDLLEISTSNLDPSRYISRIVRHGLTAKNGRTVQESSVIGFVRDNRGRILERVGPRPDMLYLLDYWSSEELDDCDSGFCLDRLRSVEYPDGTIEEYQDYDERGNITKMKLRSGGILETVYDSRSRVVSSQWKNDSSVVKRIDYQWHANGKLSAIRYPFVSDNGEEAISVYQYDIVFSNFDAQRRPRSIVKSSYMRGEATPASADEMIVGYDVHGGVTSIQHKRNGNVVNTDRFGARYSVLGDLEYVENFLSSDEQDDLALVRNSSQLLEEITGGGSSRSMEYDSNGLINSLTIGSDSNLQASIGQNEPGIGIEIPAIDEIGFAYTQDINRDLVSINDTRIRYDDFGNLIQVYAPESGAIDLEYDRAIGPVYRTTESGSAIFELDEMGRVKTARYREDFRLAEDVFFAFSYSANSVEVHDLTNGVKVVRSFDVAGRIHSELRSVDSAYNSELSSHKLAYTYDNLDRVTEIEYPDGRVATYNYICTATDLACASLGPDGIVEVSAGIRGSLQSVIKNVSMTPSGNLWSYSANADQDSVSYGYKEDGKMESYHLAGAIHREYAYDSASQLLKSVSEVNADNSKTLLETYNYYFWGALSSFIVGTVDDADLREDYYYTADGQQRLRNSIAVRDTATVAANYHMDKGSQIQAMHVGDEEYSFGYNQDGAMTRSHGLRVDGTVVQMDHSYDAAGRLNSTSVDGEQIQYRYDAFNRRVAKLTSEANHYFFHDQSGRLMWESNNGVHRQYVYVGGRVVGRLDSVEKYDAASDDAVFTTNSEGTTFDNTSLSGFIQDEAATKQDLEFETGYQLAIPSSRLQLLQEYALWAPDAAPTGNNSYTLDAGLFGLEVSLKPDSGTEAVAVACSRASFSLENPMRIKVSSSIPSGEFGPVGAWATSIYFVYSFQDGIDDYSHFTVAGIDDIGAGGVAAAQAVQYQTGNVVNKRHQAVNTFDETEYLGSSFQYDISWDPAKGQFDASIDHQITSNSRKYVVRPHYSAFDGVGGANDLVRICFGGQVQNTENLVEVPRVNINFNNIGFSGGNWPTADVARLNYTPLKNEATGRVYNGATESMFQDMADFTSSVYLADNGGIPFEPANYIFVDNTIVEIPSSSTDFYIALEDIGTTGGQTIYSTKKLPQIEEEASAKYNYLTNHIGTPVAVYDDVGSLVWQVEYMPFGSIRHYETGGDFHQPIRFPGQYHDIESGLHYNWNRYYDPGLGVYTQTDSIVEYSLGTVLSIFQYRPENISTMRYVASNPLRYVDPTGLITFGFGGAVNGGIGHGDSKSTLIVIDDNGQSGRSETTGGGLYLGAGASGTVQFQVTSADRIQDLRGASDALGGSFCIGEFCVGGEVFFFNNPEDGSTEFGLNLDVGVGVGTPEIHMYEEDTQVCVK